MLSTFIGVLGAICMVLGSFHFFSHLDMDLVVVEMIGYILVSGLIMSPFYDHISKVFMAQGQGCGQVAVKSGANSLSVSNCSSTMSGISVIPMLSDTTKFMFSVLGLFMLPWLLALSLHLHAQNNKNENAAFMMIGFVTAAVSWLSAYNFGSHLMSGFATINLYIGLNAWWDMMLNKSNSNYVFNLNIFFSLALVALFWVCMSSPTFMIKVTNSGSTGSSGTATSDTGLTPTANPNPTVGLGWLNPSNPWYPMIYPVGILSTIAYYCLGLFSCWREYNSVRVSYSVTNFDVPSYLFYNGLYVMVLYMLYNLKLGRNLNRIADLQVTRIISVFFGVVWICAKFIDYPWANWSVSLIMFGGVLYGASLLI